MEHISKHTQLPRPHAFDRYFFGIVLIISIVGLFAFTSASLGILAHSETKFYNVLFSQMVFGFVGGLLALWVGVRIPYVFWRRYAFVIFLFSLGLTLLVFVPHLGFSHGGARRWILIGPFSLQPVELLKIGMVMYFGAWLAWARKRPNEFLYKILPLVVILAVVAGTLLFQPDTKSLILMALAGAAMLFVSGVSWKKIGLIIFVIALGVTALAFFRPYVMNRIKTFLNPSLDPQGTSYQLQQSLIAVGSGGVFGRGLGQSVQKFNYLPEPQGDSIFAVIAEETGFIGSSIVVVLYVFLAIRGYKIAIQAKDTFGQYLTVGLTTLLVAQSFLNIASLIGLFPLTGVPLVFISQGGTSFAIALGSAGIILNVSKYRKTA
ncbi:MAG TPA: putative peptidoglycan glycosyltransferase FtsW [Candidatus Paceibacterota bacterium]|nr:putative peptidoglycan glycosyltransferase FtsW [Candidatus Paceibacterota bacterium]